MASEVRATFEFEISELVFFKGTQHNRNCRPNQFCVTERIAQECHGGIQRMYRLSGTDPHLLHPEIALTREEPPYRPASPAMHEEDFARSEAQTAYWGRGRDKDKAE